MTSARRRTAAVIGATALAVLGGACSPAGSSSPPGGAKAFVVARTGDIDKLDPHQATAFQTVETLALVYDTLVTTTADGKLAPGLATSWEVSNGGRTVTFALRHPVTWQDGDPFTAADVKASLSRILNPRTGAVASSNLNQIRSIGTPGPHTVVLQLSSPDQSLLYELALLNAAILHTKDIQAGTVGKRPDGTGPFAWKSWNPGQQVTLTANRHYWGSPPKIGTLEFRVIPSESSILSGMRARAFQMGLVSDPAIAQQATGSSSFRLVKEPSLSYHVLQLNGARGPLRNQQVRQAIACAINRQQVVSTAAFGDGKVTGPITSPSFQYSPAAGLPCTPGDTNAARQMLVRAGYPNGFSLSTIVETGEYATSVSEGQNLQSQLLKIGVRLNLQQLTTAPYVQAWLAADYDAAVALNGGNYDPYLMYGRYFTAGASLAKPAGITSSTLNALLAQGNSTGNEAARHQIYGQLQQALLRESPWVWTFQGDDYYLVGGTVNGFTPRPDEQLTGLASASAG